MLPGPFVRGGRTARAGPPRIAGARQAGAPGGPGASLVRAGDPGGVGAGPCWSLSLRQSLTATGGTTGATRPLRTWNHFRNASTNTTVMSAMSTTERMTLSQSPFGR